MRAVQLAALAVTAAAMLAVTGCASAGGGPAAGASPVAGVAGAPTAAGSGPGAGGCTAYAVQAIRRHVVVSGVPPACRGLSRAQLSRAAALAIREASGSGPKSAVRRSSGQASRFIAALIRPPAAGPGASPAGQGTWAPGTPAPGARAAAAGPGWSGGTAVRLAALLAWITAAGSGGYLLGSWLLAGGDLRRRGRRETGVPAPGVIAHAGLAGAGLLAWIGFLAAGRAALAWIALVILLTVAGLGMAVATLGLPGSPVQPGSPADRPRRAPPPDRPRGTPVLLIAAHGTAATLTLLLVLLVAVAVS
jgi:hypothetical protein